MINKSRRTAIKNFTSLALALTIPVSVVAETRIRIDENLDQTQQVIIELLGGLDSARFISNWAKEYPVTNSHELNRLIKNLGYAELKPVLRELIAADHIEGRVHWLDGWGISNTELQLCMLVA